MLKEKITLLRNKNLGSISVVAFELLIMAAYVIGAIIFLSCGFFLLSFFLT